MSLLFSAWQSEYEGWAALGKTKEAKGVFDLEEREGLLCMWYQGKQGRMENNLLVKDADSTQLASQLKLLRSVFERSAASTDLRFLRNEQLAKIASNFCFSPHFEAPIMSCTLAGLEGFQSEIEIRKVENDTDYTAVLQLAKEVYNDPPKLTAFFHARDIVWIYVASYQGRAVASATLWPFANIAGIYSVATHPDFRGMGLASSVIRFILADVKSRGFTDACLRTTPDLISFYQRLNFTVIGHQSLWRFSS
jgi:GNAT superfamily N-acetyltransferase